jgi:pescadillo
MSFGGQFLSSDQDDSSATHFVMDRPLSDSYMNARQTKEFIQPQYIVDCINNLYLLPTSQYKPGVPPPAHLSPFIDNVQEGYIPMRHKEIQHLKGEEVLESESEDEPMVEEPKPKKKVEKPKKVQEKQKVQKGKGDADSSSDSESSDGEGPVAQTPQERKKANDKIKKDLEQEQKEMAKVLMTNRQRKLYQKVQGEQEQKKEQNRHLKVKRKLIEKRK